MLKEAASLQIFENKNTLGKEKYKNKTNSVLCFGLSFFPLSSHQYSFGKPFLNLGKWLDHFCFANFVGLDNSMLLEDDQYAKMFLCCVVVSFVIIVHCLEVEFSS